MYYSWVWNDIAHSRALYMEYRFTKMQADFFVFILDVTLLHKDFLILTDIVLDECFF